MPDISIELEKTCNYTNFHTKDINDEYEKCDLGKIYTRTYTKKCPKCNGTGVIPTEFGEELLSFVRRYT